jgi:hypothetical protein
MHEIAHLCGAGTLCGDRLGMRIKMRCSTSTCNITSLVNERDLLERGDQETWRSIESLSLKRFREG